MTNLQTYTENASAIVPLGLTPEKGNWYAIHTMARHEKRVALHLQESRVFTFLPLVQQIRQWSDRQSKVDIPMFSCYAFVRIEQMSVERLKVLRTSGVLGFVGSERVGTPIPEEQIENLRTAARQKIPCTVQPFLSAGQRVRVHGGALNGIEGILTGKGNDRSVVVSVELLHRSVAIRVEGYEIEPI